jgi:hypothetical protein
MNIGQLLVLFLQGDNDTVKPVKITLRHKLVKQLKNVFFCVRFEVFMAVTMKNGVFWEYVGC